MGCWEPQLLSVLSTTHEGCGEAEHGKGRWGPRYLMQFHADFPFQTQIRSPDKSTVFSQACALLHLREKKIRFLCQEMQIRIKWGECAGNANEDPAGAKQEHPIPYPKGSSGSFPVHLGNPQWGVEGTSSGLGNACGTCGFSRFSEGLWLLRHSTLHCDHSKLVLRLSVG